MEAEPKIAVEDHWFGRGTARLFARSWSVTDSASRTAPIILLHDSLGSVELWRDFPAALALACERRVIAYDRLGFGRSDPFPGTLAMDFIAAEAEAGFAELVDAFALQRFILLGHSVGGGMAVNCAVHWQERCLATITVAAQTFVEDRTLAGIREAQALLAAPEQFQRLQKYHGDKAAWVLEAWVGSWLSTDFASWSLVPVLPRLRCPLLVIHGAEDEYGSLRHPQLLAELAGSASAAHVLPGIRHLPQRECPDEVLALVSEFLSPMI